MGAQRSGFGYPAAMLDRMRLAGTIVACAAVAAISVGACGCRSSGGVRGPSEPAAGSADPVAAAPKDLWIEIRVAPGRGVPDRPKVEERAARFVVLPDGSLHGETDRLPAPDARPARLRRLSREQMGDIWALLRSSGFADPALADSKGNPALVEPTPGRVLATLEIHADGERFAFVRRYTAGGEDEQAMRGVIRAVASLGWASDEALAEFAELPLRYDLGPDPYARFAPPARDAASAGTPR